MNIHFLVPGDIDTLTSYYIYDKRIMEGLRAKGHQVTICKLNDDFPFPAEESLEHCYKLLSSLPKDAVAIIDGKALGAMAPVFRKLSKPNPMTALVHIPLTADPNYTAYQRTMITSTEKEAFQYISAFVVSSEYAAEQLGYLEVDSSKIHVVIPGMDAFPQKEKYPEVPSQLISVANLSRNRDHSVLIRALAALKNKNWVLNCYGNLTSDKEYFSDFQAMIKRNELNKKIFVHGNISGKELTEAYLTADLFIHPADFETYGMSIAEALAHGIPVIASTGGGIRRTVPSQMGEFFRPGDVYGLQSILEELFENPMLYKKLYTQALTFQQQTQSWQTSIDLFERGIMRE
jgi:glycosyltransferase involved in cell wall biosynthesis